MQLVKVRRCNQMSHSRVHIFFTICWVHSLFGRISFVMVINASHDSWDVEVLMWMWRCIKSKCQHCDNRCNESPPNSRQHESIGHNSIVNSRYHGEDRICGSKQAKAPRVFQVTLLQSSLRQLV